MAEFKITIPDDKVEEVTNALCNTELEFATIQMAKQAVIGFMTRKVLSWRKNKREEIDVSDLNIT